MTSEYSSSVASPPPLPFDHFPSPFDVLAENLRMFAHRGRGRAPDLRSFLRISVPVRMFKTDDFRREGFAPVASNQLLSPRNPSFAERGLLRANVRRRSRFVAHSCRALRLPVGIGSTDETSMTTKPVVWVSSGSTLPWDRKLVPHRSPFQKTLLIGKTNLNRAPRLGDGYRAHLDEDVSNLLTSSSRDVG